MKKSKNLKKTIYQEYLKASLFPILIIEVLLLVMYFSVNGYVQQRTRESLLLDAQQNIHEIALREGRNIGLRLDAVARLTGVLRQKERRILAETAPEPLPNGTPEFETAPNGVYYKAKDNGGSALFYSSSTTIGPSEQAKALRTESFDPLFKSAKEADSTIVSVYFNGWDSMCRYYPYQPEIFKLYDPAIDFRKFNFYYLANEIHDPFQKTVWTDAYLDPAGKGWMTSCIAPVYGKSGGLEGVTGISVTLDGVIRNVQSMKLPWNAAAFLVEKNGTVLAMPERIEMALDMNELRPKVYRSHIKQDVPMPESYNLKKNKDPRVGVQFKEILDSGKPLSEFSAGGQEYVLAQSVIAETGWRLMIMVDKGVLFEPADQLNRLSNQVGFLAFVLMLLANGAFFGYLFRKSRRISNRIADPIVRVAERSTAMKNNVYSAPDVESGENIEEIALLVGNFNEMASEIHAYQEQLEAKVKERTHAVQQLLEDLKKSNADLLVEVAERKKTEAMLEQKSSELEDAVEDLKDVNMQTVQQEKIASAGELAAGVSHAIHNPLNFVTNNVHLMKDYIDTLTAFLDTSQSILRSIRNMDSLPMSVRDRIATLEDNLDIGFVRNELEVLFEDTADGMERINRIAQELRTFSKAAADTEANVSGKEPASERPMMHS